MPLVTEQQIHNKAMQGLGSMQTALINVEISRLEIVAASLAAGDVESARNYLGCTLDHMRGWTS